MHGMVCEIKGYIQPFERRLALQEMRAITSCTVTPIDGDEATASRFLITGPVDSDHLRKRLAYWHSVGSSCADGITEQIRVEATSIIARNGVSVHDIPHAVRELVPIRLPTKRCLRYATHGLHEYRGKFFPQLVRALMNVAQVPGDGIVLDPMCGSGTAVVEARLSGRTAYGFDVNPLSVFVANVKCQALDLEARSLVKGYQRLQKLLSSPDAVQLDVSHKNDFSEHDVAYLERWFSSRALLELDAIGAAIRDLPMLVLQNFYSVCLSNILRAVSWQKVDDLRVRREEKVIRDGEVIRRFLDEALRSTKNVASFLAERGHADLGPYVVSEGDARSMTGTKPELNLTVDAIITSPPYATALPYLDTDRLSLIYLGLLPRQDHRARDAEMIGNREVTDRQRACFWEKYLQKSSLLPAPTRDLIEKIDTLNKEKAVGFRRRNLSALLAKYFFDMREVLIEAHAMLRTGGVMFVVIGDNRTTAGDELVEIPTAAHLTLIAEELGFIVEDRLSMEMLVSRDIFRKNAMPSEQIITLRKA